MVRSNVYMICGRWIQTRKTLSIVSQHLCIRRARMFTWSETKPSTAHMPAHYYSAGGSSVYRMRAVDQCAVANHSQHTSAGVTKKQRYLTFTGPILPFNNVNKTCFCERQSKRNIYFFFLPIQGNCTHWQYVGLLQFWGTRGRRSLSRREFGRKLMCIYSTTTNIKVFRQTFNLWRLRCAPTS